MGMALRGLLLLYMEQLLFRCSRSPLGFLPLPSSFFFVVYHLVHE